VAENVEVALLYRKVAGPERKRRVREALERVGIAHRASHRPQQLSGGQQQRVAVARAIAKRPEILFCDEPTGSLDSASGVQVLQAIVDTAETVGTTTMIVTHNAVVADIADRALRFSNGALADIHEHSRDQRRSPGELRW